MRRGGDYFNRDITIDCGGIDGVRNQICHHLTDLAEHTGELHFAVASHRKDEPSISNLAGEEAQHVVDDYGRRKYFVGIGNLAIPAQGLFCDSGDAMQFAFRHRDVAGCGTIFAKLGPQQIQQVGNGFQRVVDLVRNDAGHAAGKRELFIHAKGNFAFLGVGEIDESTDPAGTCGTLAAKRNCTYKVPSLAAFNRVEQLHFDFERGVRGDRFIPEVCAARSIFGEKAFIVEPSSFGAQSIGVPALVDVRQGAFVIRGKNFCRQSRGQLLKTRIA